MHTTEFRLATAKKVQVLNITPQVAESVKRFGVGNGLAIVHSNHTTMGVAIQEDEPLLIQDMERWLEGLIHENPDDPWLHNCLHMRPGCPATEPLNAASHMKHLLVGGQVTVPVSDGKLCLGQWGQVMAIELDGPREERTITVMVEGEAKKDKVLSYLEELKPLTLERMKSIAPFSEEEFGELAKMAQEYMSGGKFLRSGLTAMVAEALGCERDRALEYAACIELVHCSTLVHDGILDEHLTRRGKVDLWIPIGIRKAVAVGDRMFSLVKRRFLQLGKGEAELYTQTLDTITSGVMREVNVGEFVADLLGRRVDKKVYMKIIRAKTAALFKASCQMGARAARAGEETEEALGRYGEMMGIAFQLADDAVDAHQLSKNPGEKGDLSVLLPMALHYDLISLRKALTGAIRGQGLELPYTKMRDTALKDVKRYLEQSRAALKGLRFKAGYREMLEELPAFTARAMLAEAGLELT
jgi:octaprenyl-diphosphate synthase